MEWVNLWSLLLAAKQAEWPECVWLGWDYQLSSLERTWWPLSSTKLRGGEGVQFGPGCTRLGRAPSMPLCLQSGRMSSRTTSQNIPSALRMRTRTSRRGRKGRVSVKCVTLVVTVLLGVTARWAGLGCPWEL